MKLRLWWVLVAWLGMTVSGLGQSSGGPASISVPPVIQYSNVATDAGGSPLTGTVEMTFSFYNSSTGGPALWTETQNVALGSGGQYSVYLGITQKNGLPASLFNSGQAEWLGVKIAGQPEPPRVFFVSVPYAMKAGDAATVGGLPPSAFVMAASPNTNPATATSDAGQGSVSPATSSDVTTSGGTVDFIPLWDSASDITSSVLYQSGSGSTAEVGINTTTPAATLDVNGGVISRGRFELPAAGTATAAQGYNSQALQMASSAFSSTTGTAVPQNFVWQAEPVNNDQSTASGTLNLLFATGSNTPKETGVNLASNGIMTFVSTQTFPNTVQAITASNSGITIGGTKTNPTIGINATFANENYAQLKAANTFTANQTVNGTMTATTFSGSGASLTNVNAAELGGLAASAFAQLGASSNTFTGSLTAGGFTGSGAGLTNVNAAELGGFTSSAFQPAGAYATLGANTFTGNQTVNANLVLPNANTGGTEGVINIGGNAFIHNYGASGNLTGNAFFGAGAGNFTNTGSALTGIGYNALYNDTSGWVDTAIGSYALLYNTSGTSNTGVGASALTDNTTGNNNTGVGGGAIGYNTTGGNNTGVGNGTGNPTNYQNLTGSNNTFVGYNANPGTDTAISNATAIGANAQVTQNNSLVLGSINGVNGATASTNVGIGTTTPAYTLDVYGTGHFTGNLTFASTQTFPGTGTITGVSGSNGITGGGNSGSVTLGLASNACVAGNALTALPFTCSPFATLGTNTFTNSQTVDGNLTATGIVSADRFEIGSNLFAFGTYSNENVYLGFAGNTNANNTGSYNTASGQGALAGNSGGGQNTAHGVNALNNNGTGSYNTAVGVDALFDNSTGDFNTAVGNLAGIVTPQALQTGSYDTFLGYNANTAAQANLNNATAIGALAQVTASNAMVLGAINGVNGSTADTYVGIGTTAPTSKLTVSGVESTANGFGASIKLADTASGGANWYMRTGATGTNTPAGGFSLANDNSYWMAINGGNGDVGFGGVTDPTYALTMADGAYESGGVWTNASDRNLKEAFAPVDGASLLAKLNAIPMQTWKYKTETSHIRHLGPMAQDFRAAFGLGEDDKHISTIDEGGVALAAIQQLYREGLRKEATIRRQHTQIAQLVSQLKAQQRQLKAQQAKDKLRDTQAAELLAQVRAIQVLLKTNGRSDTDIRTAKAQMPMGASPISESGSNARFAKEVLSSIALPSASSSPAVQALKSWRARHPRMMKRMQEHRGLQARNRMASTATPARIPPAATQTVPAAAPRQFGAPAGGLTATKPAPARAALPKLASNVNSTTR
jgi:Chaperone of endosialidase